MTASVSRPVIWGSATHAKWDEKWGLHHKTAIEGRLSSNCTAKSRSCYISTAAASIVATEADEWDLQVPDGNSGSVTVKLAEVYAAFRQPTPDAIARQVVLSAHNGLPK